MFSCMLSCTDLSKIEKAYIYKVDNTFCSSSSYNVPLVQSTLLDFVFIGLSSRITKAILTIYSDFQPTL